MGKDLKKISDLGFVGIIREALGLFSTHAKQLVFLQLAFVLPVVIINAVFSLLLLEQSMLLFFQPPTFPEAFGAGTQVLSNNDIGAGTQVLSDNDIGAVAQMLTQPFFSRPGTAQVLELVAFFVVAWLINLATMAVWMSGNLYAVGMIYTNTSFSFADIVHAIPRLWKRLIVTLVMVQLLVLVTILPAIGVLVLIVYTLFQTTGVALPMAILLVALFNCTLVVAFLFYAAIYQLAGAASVLEESYGWEAVKKGFKLIRGKKWVALVVMLLLVLLGILLAVVYFKLSSGNWPWSVRYVLVFVGNFVAQAFLAQFNVLCGGVLYVSFKTHHGEDLSESISLRGLARRGYKSIEIAGDGYADLEPM